MVVFAGKSDSVFRLKDALGEHNIHLTVATYPYGRKFRKSHSEEDAFIVPEITSRESKIEILSAGIDYIQGGLPFEPILSCTGDVATEMIISAYGTISKGLPHCISGAVMAFENGIVDEGEKIISASGDTAIVVTPTIRREIFCGDFRIHKILCKPE